MSRSKQSPFPFSRHPNIDYILKIGEKLWTELVGTAADFDRDLKNSGKKNSFNVSHVALAFTGVEVMAAGQKSIEGFFGLNAGGGGKTPNKRSAEDEDSTDIGTGTPNKKHRISDAEVVAQETEVSFRCSRCSKIIRKAVPEAYDYAAGREEVLASLKMEHDDFHFAKDLARGEGGGTSTSSGNNNGPAWSGGGNTSKDKKKKKGKEKEKEPKGIAKFFKPVEGSSKR